MIQFYKPNPKVTGNACSFFLTADGSIMASMIKQDSWNNAKKTGSFSKNKGVPSKSVMTKLVALRLRESLMPSRPTGSGLLIIKAKSKLSK